MWIEYIEMHNIRCYEQVRIAFHPGVNFISGANGAGKTTLIEAVGWTLFGFAPYRNMQEYFLRYGQKKGSIAIGVCMMQEGERKRFEIKRLLGTARTRSIREEDSEMCVSGEADVDDYLKRALELDRNESLSALFENVIGVRQGLFTAPFLMTPAERRIKFNTILQLDEYKKAADYSKIMVDEVKGRIQALQNDMARLEGQLMDEEETNLHYSRIAQEHQQLEKETATLLESEAQCKRQYDQQRERYETWQRALQISNQCDVKFMEARQNVAWLGKQAEQSGAACQWIQRLQAQEDRYALAAQERVHLEAEKRVAQERERMIQTLEQDIRRCEEQMQLQRAHMAENEQRTKAEIAAQSQKRTQAEREMHRIQEGLAQAETKGLHWQERERKEKEEAVLLQSLQDGWKEIEHLYARIAESEQRMAQAQEAAQKKPDLLKRHQEQEEMNRQIMVLSGKQSEIHARIQQVKKDVETFEKGECPYTRQACETVVGLKAEAKQNISNAIAQYTACTEQIEQFKEKTKHFSQIQKELAVCENEENMMVREKEERNRRMQEGRQKIAWAAECMGETIASGGQLRQRIRDRYAQHEENIQSIQQALRECVQVISQWESQKEQCLREQRESEARIRELESELKRQSEVRLAIGQEEKEQLKRKEELEKRQKDMARFRDLDARWAKVSQTLLETEAAHQDYLRNSENAERYAEDQAAYEAAQKSAEEAESEKKNAAEAVEQARNAYSSKSEKQAEMQWHEARDQRTAMQARTAEKTIELAQVKEKVEKLNAIRLEYNAMQIRIQRWEKTRKTAERCRLVLDRVGERMAQLFREQLGQEADRIHHTLSNEAVQLTWEKDYEVELWSGQGGETRKRSYRALSGGEQMSAGLALRLAMLKQLSTLGIAFFDEPTTNLDAARRQALADILPNALDGFEQVFLVSHDDTFDAITQNIISISKEESGSTISN